MKGAPLNQNCVPCGNHEYYTPTKSWRGLLFSKTENNPEGWSHALAMPPLAKRADRDPVRLKLFIRSSGRSWWWRWLVQNQFSKTLCSFKAKACRFSGNGVQDTCFRSKPTRMNKLSSSQRNIMLCKQERASLYWDNGQSYDIVVFLILIPLTFLEFIFFSGHLFLPFILKYICKAKKKKKKAQSSTCLCPCI